MQHQINYDKLMQYLQENVQTNSNK